MFGLEILDVLIGLVTIYLIFGIACTAIVEACLSWFKVRSNNLEAGLKEFLHGNLKDNQSFVGAFYQHPLVQMLSKGETGRPSYIPPTIVGQVLESILTENGTKSLEKAVDLLPDDRVKGLLKVLVTQANGDMTKFRTAVEVNFDATMDRASGWVKRYSYTVTLTVSFMLVAGANVDTIDIANSLASSPEARAKMIDIAQQHLNDAQKQAALLIGVTDKAILDNAKKQSESALARVKVAETNMKTTGLHLGWSNYPAGIEWLTKIVGLLVSVLAISLGSPFWFEILQRFMQLRTSGLSPRETKT